jgi:hypothetical protein
MSFAPRPISAHRRGTSPQGARNIRCQAAAAQGLETDVSRFVLCYVPASKGNRMLPQKIGCLVRNPVYDAALLSSAEWYGFVSSIDFGQPYFMRRGFYDWAFSHHPEPKRPRLARAIS